MKSPEAAPSVSVVLLSHQRRERLRAAVAGAMRQKYSPLELIVVDNASTDGTARMLTEEFPRVKVIPLATNLGCAARNIGVSVAHGEIVVTLDDDIVLTSEDTVKRIVAIFARRPHLACITFRIVDSQGSLSARDWCHPRTPHPYADVDFETDIMLEGACAFRRETFLAVGGYWGPLFLDHEGLDLALRLLNHGHELLYRADIEVCHLDCDGPRSPRVYYTFIRNGIWIALRHHRLRAALASIVKDMLLVGFAAARSGHICAYLRGLRDATLGICAALRTRRPINAETYRQIKILRAAAPNLIEKAKSHWHKRLI